MVANAKRYYEKTSDMHADAERMRKLVAGWMPKHNPAYQDPKYQPFPTPLPGEGKIAVGEIYGEADADAVTDDEAIIPTPVIPTPVPKSQRGDGRARKLSAIPASREVSSLPAAQNVVGDGNDFQGHSFQSAQEKIVSDVYELKDDE